MGGFFRKNSIFFDPYIGIQVEKVSPVQFPKNLHVQQDLSVSVLIILILGAIGRLWGPGSQIFCCHCLLFGGLIDNNLCE